MRPIQLPGVRPLLLSLAILAASPHAGRSWTEIAGPGSQGEFEAVSWTPAGWIAVGSQGLIRHSSDGKIWRIVEGQLLRRYDAQRRLAGEESAAGALPVRRDLHSIASLGRTVAIVGDSGTILTTRDARNWNVSRVGDSTNLSDIATDGSCLVAVGSKGTVLRSVNGADWTRATFPRAADLKQVIHAGTDFLAVGADGSLAASPDGIVWTDRSVDSLSFLEIGWKAGGHVALARLRKDAAKPTASPGVVWSSDASIWNAGEVDSFPSYTPILSGIVVDDSAWFLSDESGRLLASRDGRSWTETPFRAVPGTLHAAHDKLIGRNQGTWIAPTADALGARWAALASSTNRGIYWSPVSMVSGIPSAGVRVKGIFRRPEGWWILRNDQVTGLVTQTMLHSADLSHWDGSVSGGGYASRIDVCAGIPTAWGYGEVLQFDFAQRSMITRTPDHLVSTWQAFACGDGEMLSLGHQTRNSGSIGAVHWNGSADSTRFDLPREMKNLAAIRRFGGKWIGLSAGRDTSYLHTSADGRDWQKSTLCDSAAMTDLAANDSILIAVGRGGVVLRTQDGVRWESIALSRSAYFTQAIWSDGLFVAVGSYGDLALSRDGRSWSLDTLPNPVPSSFRTVSAAARSGDTIVVGTSDGRLFLAVDPSFSSASRPRSAAQPAVLRQGNRFLIQVDAGLPGPWTVYDIGGRRRVRGERVPGTDRVAVDARKLGRGVFFLRGAGIEARLASP